MILALIELAAQKRLPEQLPWGPVMVQSRENVGQPFWGKSFHSDKKRWGKKTTIKTVSVFYLGKHWVFGQGATLGVSLRRPKLTSTRNLLKNFEGNFKKSSRVERHILLQEPLEQRFEAYHSLP